MKKITLWLPLVVVAALIGLIITTSVKDNKAQAPSNKLQIVASLDFYGEIAQAVAGKEATVTSVIDNVNVDPHDFEPTAKTAKLYQTADVIIENGAGYDAWSTRFAQQNTGAAVLDLAKLLNYQAGSNEHLWYKLAMPKVLVTHLVSELSRLDAQHASIYKANGAAYLKTLTPLTALENTAEQRLAGVHYLATEPVYDNFLTALGAENDSLKFAQAIDEGTDPTPAEIQNWRQSVNSKQVKFVINNPQNTSRSVTQVVNYAKSHGVPVINITETKSAQTTYKDWQIKQLQAVLKAIQ